MEDDGEEDERFEISQLTQTIYKPDTEPISDDDSDGIMLLLRDPDPDITVSQCKAISCALDVTDMGELGGPSCTGYNRKSTKQLAAESHYEDDYSLSDTSDQANIENRLSTENTSTATSIQYEDSDSSLSDTSNQSTVGNRQSTATSLQYENFSSSDTSNQPNIRNRQPTESALQYEEHSSLRYQISRQPNPKNQKSAKPTSTATSLQYEDFSSSDTSNQPNIRNRQPTATSLQYEDFRSSDTSNQPNIRNRQPTESALQYEEHSNLRYQISRQPNPENQKSAKPTSTATSLQYEDFSSSDTSNQPNIRNRQPTATSLQYEDFRSSDTSNQPNIRNRQPTESALQYEEHSNLRYQISRQPNPENQKSAKPTSTATKRFADVTEAQLLVKKTPIIPFNTLKKNKWAVNLFNKWRDEFLASYCTGGVKPVYDLLSSDRDVVQFTSEELNVILPAFVVALRKSDGTDYKGETISSIACALQRHLNANGNHVNFFKNTVFNDLKVTVDSTMQEKCSKGIGIQKKQACTITPETEEILWRKGDLGSDTPRALADTVFWLIGLNFGLRGGDEHRSLSPNNFRIETDPDGHTYLEYTESVSKSYRGGLKHRNITPHIARAYENKAEPDRCPVKLFQMYRSKLHPNANPDVFYFRPLDNPKTDIWFSLSPIGHNRLEATVKRLMKTAGIPGYYTNHSLRASTATRLYRAGVSDQLIKEQTGHRSNAVEYYKRTSDKQKRKVSEMLRGSLQVTNSTEIARSLVTPRPVAPPRPLAPPGPLAPPRSIAQPGPLAPPRSVDPPRSVVTTTSSEVPDLSNVHNYIENVVINNYYVTK